MIERNLNISYSDSNLFTSQNKIYNLTLFLFSVHLDKSTFVTFFETKDKTIFILRVKIPKDPVNSPPRVYLDGVSALHPWLNENMTGG